MGPLAAQCEALGARKFVGIEAGESQTSFTVASLKDSKPPWQPSFVAKLRSSRFHDTTARPAKPSSRRLGGTDIP
jgi:hypothetical protein